VPNEIIKILLKGRVPSKKNSKVIVCCGKFPQVLSSKLYKAWHTDASYQLKAFKRPKMPITACKVSMMMYAPDRRKSDLSNKFESVADLLVDNGWLEDDNWTVMGEVSLKFGGVDKENPRVEITININE
jgi:Holliday junction resolvase RusA-like endonuclease